MIALAEVIADSKTLLRMDLRENDPYVGGLMALSLSLKVNKTLVRIDLDKEMKKEPVRLLSIAFGLYSFSSQKEKIEKKSSGEI